MKAKIVINEVTLHQHHEMNEGLTIAELSLKDYLPLAEILTAGESHPKLARFAENSLSELS